MLDDGTVLNIRPITPDDVLRLQAFHTRLSPETIHGRYLGPHPVLTTAEAEHFAHVDHQHRMAFVATVFTGDAEAIVGVARYDCLGAGLEAQAEAAIVVEDRYQGRGVGTILLHQLTGYARAHGVRTLVAEVSGANDRFMDFIRRSGLPTTRNFEGGVWEIRVTLG
jgi:GNAT superfamily N-acetyltransferase